MLFTSFNFGTFYTECNAFFFLGFIYENSIGCCYSWGFLGRRILSLNPGLSLSDGLIFVRNVSNSDQDGVGELIW